jgi:LPS-assembly protein
MALAVAIALLANQPAFAAEPTLRRELKSQSEQPVTVTGQETIYDSQTDTFTVRGNARMSQGASVLSADEIQIMRRTREARAHGHVRFSDPDVELTASDAKVNLASETLELYDAKIIARRTTYKLEGQKIRKLEGQNYAITKGFFTTCACTEETPDWAITADEMDVHVGQSGHAKWASFNVLGVPVLKLPYAMFPADTNRHSGLLTPRSGFSELRGFQYMQPYFYAINRSSDATAALDVETNQRVGLLGEYRLTNGKDDYFWINAAFYDESLRSESNRVDDIRDDQIAAPHIPLNRYGAIAMMRQHLTDELTLYGDTITVSDSLYLREMNVWTLSGGYGGNFSSLRSADSHLGALYSFDDGFARLQGTYHQDLIQPQEFALQRLPELVVSGRQQFFDGLAFANYDAQAAYLWRRKGVNGWRFDANPRLTAPVRFGDYVYAFATLGARGTVYDTSGHQVKVVPVGTHGLDFNNGLKLGPLTEGGLQARGVPWGRVGAATIIERVFNTKWASIEKLKHTIEPFATYTYVPGISQSSLPLFDEVDRVRPRSLITYGATTRLFARLSEPEEPPPTGRSGAGAPSSEVELVEPAADRGPYGEQGDLALALAPQGGSTTSRGAGVRELARITVLHAYDTNYQVGLTGGKIADVQAVATVFPTSVVWAGSQISYNPRSNGGITNANFFINLQPPWNKQGASKLYMGKALQGSFFQLSYNFVDREAAVAEGTKRNASQFMTARAYTDLFDRVGVYAGPSYDFAAAQLLQAEYGVRFKSPCDCWAFDVGVVDSFNPNEVQVQVQLTLGGLGSIGQSPFGRNPFQAMGLAGSSTGVLPQF